MRAHHVMHPVAILFLLFLPIICLPSPASAGIAERYPNDIGIENDPAVVFTENFESPTPADVAQRWSEGTNVPGMTLPADVPPGSSGNQSIQMTSVIGQNTGGHLYISFPQGYETLYARFYVKFAPDCHPVHHFVHMGGYNPPTPWPQGGAGERPDGTERFTTGIEPIGSNWSWDFYTYWMHMRGNPGGPEFWGNIFNPDPPAPIPLGEWICVELMMTCNNPVTSYNGEQAFWVNGVQAHHLGEGFPNGYWTWDKFYPDPNEPPFEGFQWRIDQDLQINFFWLLFYMTQGSNGQTDSVQFDDIVVATEYIGPIFTDPAPLRLYAQRSGTDVHLQWEDADHPNYLLIRDEAAQFPNPTTLLDGPDLQIAPDPGAAAAGPDFYYSVE